MAPYLIRIIFILLSTPPSHCFHSAAIQRHTFTKFSKNPNNSEIELDETLKKQAQFFGGSSEKDEFLTTEALAFESQLGAEESNQSNRFDYVDAILANSVNAQSADDVTLLRTAIQTLLSSFNLAWSPKIIKSSASALDESNDDNNIYSFSAAQAFHASKPSSLYTPSTVWSSPLNPSSSPSPSPSPSTSPLSAWYGTSSTPIENLSKMNRKGLTILSCDYSSPNDKSAISISWSISFVAKIFHQPRVTVRGSSILTIQQTTPNEFTITKQVDTLTSPKPIQSLGDVFSTLVLPQLLFPKYVEAVNLFSGGNPASEDVSDELNQDTTIKPLKRGTDYFTDTNGDKPFLDKFEIVTTKSPQLIYSVTTIDDSPGPNDKQDPTFQMESFPDAGFVSEDGIRVVGAKKDSYAMTSGWDVFVKPQKKKGVRAVTVETPVSGELIPRGVVFSGEFGEESAGCNLKLPQSMPQSETKATYKLLPPNTCYAKASIDSKVRNGPQQTQKINVLDKNDEGGPTDDKVKFVREALYNSVEAYLDGRGNGSGLKICVEDDRPAFGYKWGYKSGGRRLCWGGRDDETTTVVAGESKTLSNVGVVMAIYESDPLKAGCGDGEVKLKLRR